MSKPTKKDLSDAILSMTYAELVRVADALAKMKRARLETREDFAALLHEWADAQ